ncbi:LysR family transcriptional regulator [Nonomuraea africana]|uniref:DNA-binding transcriptional LysR family regulator n=1 Tax=Nonomuraea africana TaxID=46171 RepID=A0ABR9KB03_9ACTN|nr:LysR family transcriptional regulator [Nonomuraea africana]MBE1559178.1 DNA-binding transcriptional LysR family regulator [Nonomuraea africana]
MEVEIRHLRIICAIAESGSLTRAAKTLRLSQPGLTAQLRRIETMLGGTLFERAPQGVRPTAFGELVLARSRAVLPAIDDLVFGLRAPAQNRTLRIGTVNAPLLTGLLTWLDAAHPEALVTTVTRGAATRLVELVEAAQLELAVVGDCPGYELAAGPSVVLRPVATEPVFAMMAVGHPLAAKTEVTLTELAAEDWIAPPPDDDRIREYWTTIFHDAGLAMRVRHEAEGTVLLDLVLARRGVSLCQATFRQVPGLAIRPIAGDPLWYRHLLAWHRDAPFAAAAAEVVEHARHAYDEASRRNDAYPAWLAGHTAAGGMRRE